MRASRAACWGLRIEGVDGGVGEVLEGSLVVVVVEVGWEVEMLEEVVVVDGLELEFVVGLVFLRPRVFFSQIFAVDGDIFAVFFFFCFAVPRVGDEWVWCAKDGSEMFFEASGSVDEDE